MRRKQDKPLTVVHVDRLEAYRGTAVPAWMTAEQPGCVAVQRKERPGTSGKEGTLPRGDRPVLRPRLNWEGQSVLTGGLYLIYSFGKGSLGETVTVELTCELAQTL